MSLCQKCLFEATCKCRCKNVNLCVKHFNEHIRSEVGNHWKEDFFDEINIESKFLMLDKLDELKEEIQAWLSQIKNFTDFYSKGLIEMQTLMKSFLDAIQLINKIYVYILKAKKIQKQPCPSVVDFYLIQPPEIMSKYLKDLKINLERQSIIDEVNAIKRKLVNFNFFRFSKYIFGISKNNIQKEKSLSDAFYSMGYEFLCNKEYEKAEMAFSRCRDIHELEKTDDKIDILRQEIYSAIFPFLKANDYTQLAKVVTKAKAQLNYKEKAGLYHELARLYRAISLERKAIRYYKTAIKKIEQSNPIKFWLFLEFGSFLKDLGKREKAMKFYKMGLKFGKEIQHEGLAKVYNCIALLNSSNCNFNEAEKYFGLAKRTLEMCNGSLEDYAMIIHNYANLYLEKNQISEGLILLKKAKEIYKNKILNEELLSMIYDSLGIVYRRAGNSKKAHKAFRKERTILEKYLPQKHPIIAGTYMNIANTDLDIGDIQRGIALLKQSADIFEMFHQWEKLGYAYLSLANAYFEKQDFPEADDYLTKACPILEKFGTNEKLAEFYLLRAELYRTIKKYDKAQENIFHASKILAGEKKHEASLLFEAACLHNDLGRFDEAQICFIQCKELRENALSDEDNLCNLYNNMSVFYRNLGNMNLAENFALKSLNIAKRIYPPYHANLARVYKEFGTLCLILHKDDEAEKYLMEAMKIFQRKDSYQLLNLANIYMNIGNLKRKNKKDEAKIYYSKSIEVLERCGMSNTINMGDVTLNLGGLYYDLKDLNSAEYYFLIAMNIYEQLLDPYSKQLLLVYWNIGNTYFNMKVRDKALNFYLKCKNIIERSEPNEYSRMIFDKLKAKLTSLN